MMNPQEMHAFPPCEEVLSATSDAEGRFTLEGLPAGGFVLLRASHPDYCTEFAGSCASLDARVIPGGRTPGDLHGLKMSHEEKEYRVRTGQPLPVPNHLGAIPVGADDVVVTLRARCTLTGRVTYAAGAEPAARVAVVLAPGFSQHFANDYARENYFITHRTWTDDEGVFSISGLAAYDLDYRLYVVTARGEAVPVGVSHRVDQPTEAVAVSVPEPVHLAGAFVMADTGAPARDLDGKLWLKRKGNWLLHGEIPIQEDGTFEGSAPPGIYELRVYLRGMRLPEEVSVKRLILQREFQHDDLRFEVPTLQVQ